MEERSCMDQSLSQSEEQGLKHVNNNDLHDFLKSFDTWQTITESLIQVKTKLSDEVSSLSNDKQKILAKNEELQNQITYLQNVVDSTHTNLNRMCDIEEENREINAKMEELRTEILTINAKMEDREKEHLKEIEEISKDNEVQKEGVKNSMKIVLEQERETHQIEMDKKNKEIEDLKEKIIAAGKENECEIVRISMEYENKLAKLRQKIPCPTAQTSSSNQEIFRMKLHHMKNDYDREVRMLKERIQELEDQLYQPSEGHRVNMTSNKKRRF